MVSTIKLGAFFLLILTFVSCDAFALAGRVVKITDGDTLVILTSDQQSIKVRLKEIDAPERGQAFGRKSTETLAAICAGVSATLTDTSKDRYGRTLARVSCNGIDANAHMVETGMAWVYDRYVKDRSLYELQKTAQQERLGLWVDKRPIPPWKFRKQNR